jgi:uncharacterized protein (UPF0305 family)
MRCAVLPDGSPLFEPPMKKSQLVKDLQNRLSYLLKDAAFANARQVRAAQRKLIIEDAIAAYNLTLSEELLRLHAASVNGTVEDKVLSDFRKHLTYYMEEKGTGHKGYDTYVAIICEYLAMVAQKPLHPPEVRQMENNPPKDTDNHKYCALKTGHIKDPFSLCRFCNCIGWPETKG